MLISAICLLNLFFIATSEAELNNPRSVHLALETVLAFNNNDTSQNIKFLDDFQDFLVKVRKTVVKNDKSNARNKKPIRRMLENEANLKFSEFIVKLIKVLNNYRDEDLEEVVAVMDDEVRKYHYKGCLFYELLSDHNIRRYVAEKLYTVKEQPAKLIRKNLEKTLQLIGNAKFNSKQSELLDYINSLFTKHDVTKFQEVLENFDTYRLRSKRANLELIKLVRNAIKGVIFDHYSNLSINTRRDFKIKLEKYFLRGPYNPDKKENMKYLEWTISRPNTPRNFEPVTQETEKFTIKYQMSLPYHLSMSEITSKDEFSKVSNAKSEDESTGSIENNKDVTLENNREKHDTLEKNATISSKNDQTNSDSESKQLFTDTDVKESDKSSSSSREKEKTKKHHVHTQKKTKTKSTTKSSKRNTSYVKHVTEMAKDLMALNFNQNHNFHYIPTQGYKLKSRDIASSEYEQRKSFDNIIAIKNNDDVFIDTHLETINTNAENELKVKLSVPKKNKHSHQSLRMNQQPKFNNVNWIKNVKYTTTKQPKENKKNVNKKTSMQSNLHNYIDYNNEIHERGTQIHKKEKKIKALKNESLKRARKVISDKEKTRDHINQIPKFIPLSKSKEIALRKKSIRIRNKPISSPHPKHRNQNNRSKKADISRKSTNIHSFRRMNEKYAFPNDLASHEDLTKLNKEIENMEKNDPNPFLKNNHLDALELSKYFPQMNFTPEDLVQTMSNATKKDIYDEDINTPEPVSTATVVSPSDISNVSETIFIGNNNTTETYIAPTINYRKNKYMVENDISSTRLKNKMTIYTLKSSSTPAFNFNKLKPRETDYEDYLENKDQLKNNTHGNFNSTRELKKGYHLNKMNNVMRTPDVSENKLYSGELLNVTKSAKNETSENIVAEKTKDNDSKYGNFLGNYQNDIFAAYKDMNELHRDEALENVDIFGGNLELPDLENVTAEYNSTEIQS